MSARANIGPHVWTRQPQYLAPVARSDLARGLVLLWNGATPQFAQVGGVPTTFNNAAPSRPGFQARTPPFNGSNVDVRWNRAVTGTNPSEVTMFARCYLAAAGAEYTIMGMSRSSSANPLFRIQRNGTGFWQAQFRGDGASFTNVSGGSAPTSYRVYDIVGVFRSGTGQKELWIDGLQIATSTTDIGTITLDQTEIGSLVRNSAAQFWNGGIFVAGIYNRALSAGEIAALSENPWQLFMPPRRRLYIGEAVAGGAVTHATTGAVSGGGSLIDGAAARTRLHAANGDLYGPGATLGGSAARLALHITSGVLIGSSAILDGIAARTRAHPASGDLIGGGAIITGDVIRSEIPEHFTSGAILGDGASVSGSAARFRAFDTSGDIVGAGAVVDGAADKTGPAEHAASGSFVGGGSAVDGQANRYRALGTSGDIGGDGAAVVGIAAIIRTHDTSGSLFGDGALITSVVIRGGQVELLYVAVTARAAFACVVSARGAYLCTVSEAIAR